MSISTPQKILLLPTALLVITLLLLYIWQVNAMMGKTYLRDSLLRRVEELGRVSSELSILHSQSEFLGNGFGGSPEFSSFEKVNKITYLKVSGGTVVRLDTNETPAP